MFASIGAAIVDGASPRARFNLHVKDRYGWSTPDAVEVRIDQSPLWFLRLSPPVAQRFSGRSHRLAPGSFLGAQAASIRRPIVAHGPDGNSAFVVLGDDSNVGYANRFTPEGVSFFKDLPSNEGHELRTEVAAHDGDLLWAAFDVYTDVDNPGHTFMVATTGGFFPLGVGEYSQQFGTNPEFRDLGRLAFLVVAPDRTAFGAEFDGTDLLRFTLDGIGGIGVTRTGGFTGIRGLDIAPDGTLFVSDGAAVRVFAPDGAETVPIEGLGRVDALRYERTEPALWVNGVESGLWVLPAAGERERVSDPIGEVSAIRITPDGLAWVAARGTNEIWRISPPLAELSEPILSGGVNTGASGVLFGDAPLMSFQTVEEELGEVMRLPPFGSLVGGISPPLGAFRDASTEVDRGGAWLAFADPARVFLASSDGRRVPETEFSFLDVGGTIRSLVRPRRISVDPATRALWVVEGEPNDVPVQTRWLLAMRAATGPPAIASGMAYEERLDETVHRIRAAGGGADPAAWAYVGLPNTDAGRVVFLKRNGVGFTRTQIDAQFPVGPAVSTAGTAWFARAQNSGTAFSFTSAPSCTDANTASQCLLGTRLAFASPGSGAVTPFVPPGVDLGNCSGGLCSVLPLDVAYDSARDDLWLAAVDHGDAGASNQFRFWRFSCVSVGTAPQNCSAANLRTATWPTSADSPLETTFDLDGEGRTQLIEQFPDLLGIDAGTGDAYFLEPLTGRVDVLHVDESTGTPRMQRIGFFPTDGMSRTAIGR